MSYQILGNMPLCAAPVLVERALARDVLVRMEEDPAGLPRVDTASYESQEPRPLELNRARTGAPAWPRRRVVCTVIDEPAAEEPQAPAPSGLSMQRRPVTNH